jgi:hypothetical protein
MDPDLPRAIAARATRQHRNVTRRQLLALGLGREAIKYRVRTGVLHRVYPGVYSVGLPPRTVLERAAAAVLACGPGAALGFRSALCHWGFVNRWHAPPFDVIVARDRRPKGINTHRLKGLTPADFRTHLGIRVTSPARTVLDCAPNRPRNQLVRIINDGRRAGLLHLGTLTETVERFPNHPGTKRIRNVLTDAPTGGPTDSGFEDDFLAFCERYALPRPHTNVYVAGHRVDALFADAKLIIGCDGWDFHNTRDSFESDRDRDADTLAAGHATVRITKRRVNTTPDHEARRLHEILTARTTSH